ncbi:MAG: 16S rRNA (guanine(966)-N(2))-methyltransferase RsmD [Rhodospirillales bacterium]|jgi:16S rRNA (guanine966-N2)-methyltransferase|nr:16S rRNA (guanine(966)-N(2))-methyltransferase RsmD [Rhodospirillales bacterium]MBT4040020.1 16S rRNA (guanine(966)-N(2))-methyltransferase RsmD [Rhodospirillales bacterium]MBT4627881.1 16S rRNA (guanine(966)-N(2))-methyltransferase RsmD [Rhodospirillales bacterium]MBT5351421.1 16S rRNA (guanine(966)-N(2))-methyltransferase RsmD [Rhodospirillales bacterium]MBT5521990.1 16S rRNA (guanine(966)-N(2))-methyltransferase RsmD [Rhodospirillales bacterium]
MRIVGGNLKGRTIKAPAGADVRPTSDRARESLFNVLLNGRNAIDLNGARVLDVFAGTGALGLEALSRGAAHAVFVDNNRPSIACIKGNAETFNVTGDISIISGDARTVGKPPPVLGAGADVVFLDPPYKQDLVIPSLERLVDQGWVSADCMVIAETEADYELPRVAGFDDVDSRKYGAARITFLRRV